MESIWTKQYINSIKQIVSQALFQRLGNHADFEDLEQEVMMRVFSKHNKIPTGVTRISYIRSIALNYACDTLRPSYRNKNKVQTISIYNGLEANDTDLLVCDQLTCNPTQMSDPFLAQAVAQALSKLSPPHQEVLLLKAENLQYKEMAQVLNISEGTVRSRLHHARKQCAEHLAPHHH